MSILTKGKTMYILLYETYLSTGSGNAKGVVSRHESKSNVLVRCQRSS